MGLIVINLLERMGTSLPLLNTLNNAWEWCCEEQVNLRLLCHRVHFRQRHTQTALHCSFYSQCAIGSTRIVDPGAMTAVMTSLILVWFILGT